jgi:hypothetical protein
MEGFSDERHGRIKPCVLNRDDIFAMAKIIQDPSWISNLIKVPEIKVPRGQISFVTYICYI